MFLTTHSFCAWISYEACKVASCGISVGIVGLKDARNAGGESMGLKYYCATLLVAAWHQDVKQNTQSNDIHTTMEFF